MSVINTMLKDLERRGANGEATGDKILGGLSSGRPNYYNYNNESSNKTFLLSLISVIVIVAIIIGGYYLSPYKLVEAAVSKVDPVITQTEHAATAIEVQHAQQTKSVPVVSNVAVVAQAGTTHTLTTQNKPDLVNESAPTLQKVSVQQPSPVMTVTAAKVVGVVNRVPAEAATKDNTIAQPVVAKAAQPKIERTVTEDETSTAEDDTAETTDESLHVVTKQQRAFTPAEQGQQAYATAVAMYDQSRKQEAKSFLTQALAFDPGNADACRLLAVIYLENGRADLAADTVASGLKLHEKDQNLLRMYVQTLVKQKKYSEAIMVMGRRIQLTSPEDLGYLAGLYQKDNDHLEAVKYYTEALQLVPSKSVWWLGEGISLEILQQYQEAIQSYQKSVSTGGLSTNLMEYAINRINVIKKHHPDLKS